MKERLLAFQLSGSHYKHWGSGSAKVNTQEISPESMDTCLDTIVSEAESNPKSKIRVAIST